MKRLAKVLLIVAIILVVAAIALILMDKFRFISNT